MTTAIFAPSLDIIVPLIMVPWWLPVNFLWNVLVIAGTLAAQGVLRSRPSGNERGDSIWKRRRISSLASCYCYCSA